MGRRVRKKPCEHDHEHHNFRSHRRRGYRRKAPARYAADWPYLSALSQPALASDPKSALRQTQAEYEGRPVGARRRLTYYLQPADARNRHPGRARQSKALSHQADGTPFAAARSRARACAWKNVSTSMPLQSGKIISRGDCLNNILFGAEIATQDPPSRCSPRMPVTCPYAFAIA